MSYLFPTRLLQKKNISCFQYQLSKSTISFGRFFAWGIFCGSVPTLGILRSLGMKYSIGFGITISSFWSMICSLLIQEKIYQMGLMFLSGIGISSLASGIHQMAGQICKRHERSQYAVLITGKIFYHKMIYDSLLLGLIF